MVEGRKERFGGKEGVLRVGGVYERMDLLEREKGGRGRMMVLGFWGGYERNVGL